MKVLVTCPPMLRMMEEFAPRFAAHAVETTLPEVVQTLSVSELVELVPRHDGWIIGDDPANREVFAAGREGRLRVAVKWGVGVDNVDFEAARELGIPVVNTPGVFGGEVADVAMSYLIALARETFVIDRAVREGGWPKPRGISLEGRTAALVGFGDIGRNLARRMLASGLRVVAYDPAFAPAKGLEAVVSATWPERLGEADFLAFTCALTPSSRHMFDESVLGRLRPGVRIVNVGRGPLIDEGALAAGLESGVVHSAALDVFEVEPLPEDSPLRRHDRTIFGSHNSSNTEDGVRRVTEKAIRILFEQLGVRE